MGGLFYPGLRKTPDAIPPASESEDAEMRNIFGWCAADFVTNDDELNERAVKTSPLAAIQALQKGDPKDRFDIVHPLSMMSYPGPASLTTWEYLVRKDRNVSRSDDPSETDPRDPTVAVVQFKHEGKMMVAYSIKGTGNANEMLIDVSVGRKSRALFLPYLKKQKHYKDNLPEIASSGARPRFHHGMLAYACNAFDLISKDFESIQGDVHEVMFFGHSLGAACAMMCAHMFRAKRLDKKVEPIVDVFNGLTTIYIHERKEGDEGDVNEISGDDGSNAPEAVTANFIEAYIGEDPEDEGYEEPTEEEVDDATHRYEDTLYKTIMLTSKVSDFKVTQNIPQLPSAMEAAEIKEYTFTGNLPTFLRDDKYNAVASIFCGVLSCPNYVSACCEMALDGSNMDDSFRVVNYMNFGDGVINNGIARASKVKYPTTVSSKKPSIATAITHGITRWGYVDPYDLYDGLSIFTNIRRATFMHGKWIMPDDKGRLALYYFKDADVTGEDELPAGLGFMRPLANAVRHLQAVMLPAYRKRVEKDSGYISKKMLVDEKIAESWSRFSR